MTEPRSTTPARPSCCRPTVEHVDITSYDARPIIDAMRKMSFTSRDTARAADISTMTLEDPDCSILADAGRLDLGRRLHARLPRHGDATA